MANTLQGAKSKLYLNKDSIPGIADIEANDSLQHVSAPEIAGQRVGLDVIVHGRTPVVTGAVIATGSVKRKIVITGHGLVVGRKGYILIPTSGNAFGEEVAVLSVVDANTLIIAAELDMAIGDTVDLCRHITPNYTDDGDLNVVVTAAGPTQFIKDAATVTVTEDTATPANNIPLPSGMFIVIDGVAWPVGKDTVTPANTVAIPVELSGVAGPVNITAGDLNVQLSDSGANPDIVKIGNGTNRLDINASNEALVHDADALAQLILLEAKDFATETSLAASLVKLTALEAKDFATQTTLAAVLAALGTLNGKDFATQTTLAALLTELQLKADLTDTQPVSAASLPLPSGAATETTQTANGVLIGAVNETAPATDTASSGLNGRLQRVAQRITSLIALLPAALGQTTKAGSLSVTIASDQVVEVQPKAGTTGSTDKGTLGASASTSHAAPANALGFVLKVQGASTGDLYWEIGAAATTASSDLTSGQGTAFTPCTGTVNLLADANGASYCLQWIIK